MTDRTPNQSGSPAIARAARRPARARHWWFLPYLGFIALICLIVAGLWPKPLPVETVRLTAGRLQATVNEEGKTRIKHRYTVSAPVAGQLRRIELKPGAEVVAGQTLLAVIDPVTPGLLDERTRRLTEARRDSAAANVEKARVAQRFALSEFARFQNLFKQQTISTQELENVQWRADSATKDLESAEALLRQAEAELASFEQAASGHEPARPPVEVTSPITGRVLRVLEENARVVAPGTPLLEVGNPSDLEVVVDVLSRDGAAIAPGIPVELSQWGGPDLLQGRVRLVEPAAFTKISALGVEEQRVNVIVDLLAPPEQRPTLGDNFRVEARIVVWQADQVLKVPAGALFRRGEQWCAFVVENGRAHARVIKVGRSSGTETQVLEGLTPGQELVLYPGSRVADGQRVVKIEI